MGGTDALRDLLFEWDQAGGPLAVDALRRALGNLRVRGEDVAKLITFSDESYQRILIRRTSVYEALLLCWQSGQRSPIHDHGGSVCGVRVIAGTATETLYEASACGYLVPMRSRTLVSGSVTVACDADIHQMANLAPAGRKLLTLHVYSPPLQGTRTYSIGETTLADHDRLAALRPRVLTRRLRVDQTHHFPSNTPRRASGVRP